LVCASAAPLLARKPRAMDVARKRRESFMVSPKE
jgi:hypothetical protein